jgi:hypothetical protein
VRAKGKADLGKPPDALTGKPPRLTPHPLAGQEPRRGKREKTGGFSYGGERRRSTQETAIVSYNISFTTILIVFQPN